MAKKMMILSGIRTEDSVSPFMELLYVTKGLVTLKTAGQSLTLRSGGLYLLCPEEKYSAASAGDTIVLKIQFDLSALQEGSFFRPVVIDREAFLQNDTDRRRITILLNSILREMAEQNRAIRLNLLYYSLFDLLANSYLRREDYTESGPLAGILDELGSHWGNCGSLAEYAARLFLSESAFSRRFQKATGVSFSDYAAQLKTRHAAELLWNTDMTVTGIAEETGFGSSAVMQRHFRKMFACSPTQYRKRRDEQELEVPAKAAELKEILSRISDHEVDDHPLIRIRVSGNQAGRTRKGEMHCIHIGDARWLLDGDIREQLMDVSRVLGIHAIALGNLFDPYFRIRHGHDTSHLHFEMMDRALDQILAAGCTPVIILPENRNITIRDIGNSLRDTETGEVFSDPDEWESVFGTFLVHALERHTYAALRDWIFVLEHSPFQDSAEARAAYREIYRRSFILIRKYVPGAQIWANTLNSTVLPELLEEDLQEWKQNGILPDALNLMVYPYRVEARKNEQKGWDFSLLRIDADLHFVREELDSYADLAAKCGCSALPKAISEWNTSLSERNPYNDSCAKACHMLVQMVDASSKAGWLFYHGFSDLMVSGFEEAEPLIGASALLTRNGIKKPAFYAMEFWGRLGDYIVCRGENYIVATNHGTAFQILVFHPTKMSEEYKLIPESEHRMDELTEQMDGEGTLHFEIHFPDLTEKKRLRIYHMSDREGAVYTEWKKIGSPSHLSPSELRYLKARSIPSLKVSSIYPDAHGITISTSLEPNAFSLMLLD